MRTWIISLLIVTTPLALAGCTKKNADLELSAAEKAMKDALEGRARDCAPETYVAAEGLLADARALAQQGKAEEARAKALEAERLAKQAAAASPEGCDKKKDEAPVDPNAGASSTDLAGRGADLGSLEQTIYFDYNDSAIREDGKIILTKLAQLMIKDPGVRIEVEGHCDERGSTEYNLHLGERRARAVEKYLLTQGVKGGQINTISYGEERPLDLAPTEAAFAKNRRAEIRKAQ